MALRIRGVLLLISFSIAQAEQLNIQDAYVQKLVGRATDYFCKNGADATAQLLSKPLKNPQAQDAYMWMYTPTGTIRAHGADKNLIGKNITQIPGINGKSLLKAKLHAIKNKQKAGWAEYMLHNKRRRNYVQAIQNKTGVYLLGAGYTVTK
jgi:cytochrome c